MNIKPIIYKISFSVGIFVFSVAQLRGTDSRPNILFIMSDDHTWQALGCYKSHLAVLNPTPTLDRLAAEGMMFGNALCTNSICTPSRAAIMTGQYAHVNGVLTLNEALPEEKQHLAREMKSAGYQTAIIGKWHLKDRPSAFDYYKVLPGQGKYFNPTFYESGVDGEVQMIGHSTDCITSSVLDWFEEVRDPEKPFFLKMHFKAPHDYFEHAPRYKDYLKGVDIPEPESLWHRGEGSIATRGYEGELEDVIATSIGRRNFRRNYVMDYGLAEELSDEEAKRTAYNIYLKQYLRCVKGVDDNVKRVIDYMDQNGLLDNTVIIYTGDQGFFLGEHDMQDKRWAYEPSLRVPLIVRYPPAIAAGSQSDAIVENVDFPVTMLDFAGVNPPDYMQGSSFRSILETGEEAADWKTAGYYQYWMHMAHHDVPAHIAMRTKRYKLILFHGAGGDPAWSARSGRRTPGAWELYDLQNDPHEMNNLADDSAYSSLLQELKIEFARLRKTVRADDPSSLEDPQARAYFEASQSAIEEFWETTLDSERTSIKLSHDYHETFGHPEQAPEYVPNFERPFVPDSP